MSTQTEQLRNCEQQHPLLQLPHIWFFFLLFILEISTTLRTSLAMSELTFTKSFLSTLDSRPIKLRADHVFDPEQVGLRVPVSLDCDASLNIIYGTTSF